jgi:probable rRNA maturation factor
MIEISISNRQDAMHVDHTRIRSAVEIILSDAAIKSGEISVAIIDDETMHQLNREHLQHDYPTDVLSFVLDRTTSRIEGEVIVSSDTAIARAAEFQLRPEDELLLYVIHGTLHLVGYDDKDETKVPLMRKQETHYLGQFGIRPAENTN